MTISHDGIDHIYFKAHDTYAVKEELQRLGFSLTSRDLSADAEVSIISCVFQSTWISIGASEKHGEQEPAWMAMLPSGATPLLLLKTQDNHALEASMRDVGATTPVDIMTYERQTTGPAGPIVLRFEMSTGVGGPIPAPLMISGMRHLTPEWLFRDDLIHHRNGVLELVAFTVELADVDGAREGLVKLFGADRIAFGSGEASIDLGNAKLILSERAPLQRRYGELFEPAHTTFARFRVSDLEAARACFVAADISPRFLENPQALAVRVASLHDCIFEFTT